VSALHSFLRRHKRIALDTNVFIYTLEENPRYVGLAKEVLAWVEQQGNLAVTSTITMTEVLVKPYKAPGVLAARLWIYGLLSTYPNLEWVAVDLEIADLAARFRAHYGLKTPDALHAATAARSGATGLVTNDSSFQRVPAFETLTLDSLL
jgi:predicted nucleic acid-binding protein